MIRIYFTDRKNFPDSELFIKSVLCARERVKEPHILRSAQGKPYLADSSLQFSLSHTDQRYFLAVAEEKIGIDAEPTDRKTEFKAVAKRYFPECEISDALSFLRLWTVKESAVKLIGGTIARDMKKFCLQDDFLLHAEHPPVRYLTTKISGCFVTISTHGEITQPAWIAYP